MRDRIIIMKEGQIVTEVKKEAFSENEILSYAIGGH